MAVYDDIRDGVTYPAEEIRRVLGNADYLDEDGIEQMIYLLDNLTPVLDALRHEVRNYGRSEVARIRRELRDAF
jgi:hypothetical protein